VHDSEAQIIALITAWRLEIGGEPFAHHDELMRAGLRWAAKQRYLADVRTIIAKALCQ
jgi:hypothetical protein